MSLLGLRNKVPKEEWLKQEKRISSQIWRVEFEIKALAGWVSSVVSLLGL